MAMQYHTCFNCGSTLYQEKAPADCPMCGKNWRQQARPGKSPKDTKPGEAGYMSTDDTGLTLPASSAPRDGQPTKQPPR